MRKLLAVLVAVLALAACSSNGDTTAAPATSSTTTAPPTTTTTVDVTLSPAPDGCTPAAPATVDAIERNLNSRDWRIGQAFTADGYVVANIYTDEGRESAEVWLVRDGKLYALSGDANDLSISEDGRGLASASDPPVEAVQACVVASLQLAQSGTTIAP